MGNSRRKFLKSLGLGIGSLSAFGLTSKNARAEQKNNKEKIMEKEEKISWLGDKLNDQEKDGLISKVQGFGRLYTDKKDKEISKFYKGKGALTTHEEKTIHGKKKIASYLGDLRNMGVAEVRFNLECVYAKKLKKVKVADLIDSGITEKEDLPSGVKEDDMVTHVAYVIISYSFELGGQVYNQPPPSFGIGFHIMGCVWF
jgi:hypothetical protein